MMEWITVHVLEKYNFWIAMLIIIIGLTATIVKGKSIEETNWTEYISNRIFPVGRITRRCWKEYIDHMGLENANSTHFMDRSCRERIHIC